VVERQTGLNKTLILILISLNAGLYTVVGYITYFGIVVFGVRFWPAVVVPAVFAVLFGSYVGDVGAAIGIFISDMLTHGMPLLSLYFKNPHLDVLKVSSKYQDHVESGDFLDREVSSTTRMIARAIMNWADK